MRLITMVRGVFPKYFRISFAEFLRLMHAAIWAAPATEHKHLARTVVRAYPACCY